MTGVYGHSRSTFLGKLVGLVPRGAGGLKRYIYFKDRGLEQDVFSRSKPVDVV